MRKFLTLSIAMAIFMFVFITQASDYKFRLFVDVICDNVNIKSFINSQVKRELQVLPDVSVITNPEEAGSFLRIIVAEVKNEFGGKTGDIAVAFIHYIKLSPPIILETLVNSNGNITHRRALESMTKNSHTHPSLGIYTGETDGYLETICKSIVVDVNTNGLEPLRKMRQKLLKDFQ